MTAPPDDGSSSEGLSESGRKRVLYPIFQSESDAVLRLAVDIAEALDGELVVGYVDVEGQSYEVSRETAQVVLEAKQNSSTSPSIEGKSFPGPSPRDAVVTAADTYDIDVIVMDDDISERLEAQIAKHADRETVVVGEQGRLESVASILVPVAGGPHSGGAVDVAGAIAEANDAWVELLHVVEADGSASTSADETAEALVSSARARLPECVDVDSRIVEAEETVDEILTETNHHDLTVIGAPRKGRLRRAIFGSTAEAIHENSRSTVVMVRQPTESRASLLE